MDRRSFLIGSASLAASRSAFGQHAPQELPPAFDPGYSHLPTLEQQTAGLTAAAVQAQQHPRIVAGLPVTGLPVHLENVDQQLAEEIRSAGIVGLAYAIAIESELVVTRGFGHLCSHDRALATPTAPAYLGSITKPLCAMTALKLVQAGQLKLDQRVTDILPLAPLLKPGEHRQPEIDHVTVRMLMNHTSGLFNVVEDLFDRPYYRNLARQGHVRLVHQDVTQFDLVRRGMSKPFVSKPGTAHHYSGQGLQVLGRIVERLTGHRLDKSMSGGVLRPMGVNYHASLGYLDRRVWAQIAAGMASATQTFIPSPYSEPAKRCVSWQYQQPPDNLYGNHWGQADACGSSMLSAVDLLRFVTFCFDSMDERLVNEALTAPPGKPGSNGLGWGVSKHSGEYQYGHGGAWGGIRAFCESTWDGVQYAVVGVCDQSAAFNKIVQQVAQLGRSLHKQKTAAIGWDAYGFR